MRTALLLADELDELDRERGGVGGAVVRLGANWLGEVGESGGEGAPAPAPGWAAVRCSREAASSLRMAQISHAVNGDCRLAYGLSVGMSGCKQGD